MLLPLLWGEGRGEGEPHPIPNPNPGRCQAGVIQVASIFALFRLDKGNQQRERLVMPRKLRIEYPAAIYHMINCALRAKGTQRQMG
jgi:hypothetical protein